MYFLGFVLTIVLSILTLCPGENQQTSGPYRIEMTSMQECDDTGTGDILYQTRITKYTRNITCYDGNIHLGIPFSDNVHVVVEVATRGSNGGWNANHFRWKLRKGCSEFRKWFPDWFWLVETENMTHPRPCPIPKGNYTIKCLDFSDIQFSSARTLQYATYRFGIHYFVNATVKVGCVTYVADVLPREDYLQNATIAQPKQFTSKG